MPTIQSYHHRHVADQHSRRSCNVARLHCICENILNRTTQSNKLLANVFVPTVYCNEHYVVQVRNVMVL